MKMIVGLFMPYLCYLFFIFSHEYRNTGFFAYFLEYILLFLNDNLDKECE